MEQKQNQAPEHLNILLEWVAPDFIPLPRGKRWYLAAGLFTAILIAYALLSGSITMAIVFALLAGLFILTEKKPPRDIRVLITDMGIQYGGEFYPYHHINAFWIVFHPPYVRALYLKLTSGKRYRIMKIELDEQAPQAVRTLLLKEIPEIEGAQEPATDLMARILRLQ